MLTLNSDAKVKVNNDLTASRLTKPHLPYFHILVHIAGERREARMHQKPGMSDREAEASVRTVTHPTKSAGGTNVYL